MNDLDQPWRDIIQFNAKTPRADNFPVSEEDEVRLSPFAKAHFNMLGRYSFSMPDEVKDGKLRSLRDPNNP